MFDKLLFNQRIYYIYTYYTYTKYLFLAVFLANICLIEE